MTGTQQSEKEKLEILLKDYVWGYICKDCNGGGYDYEKNQNCPTCEGRGIHDWHIEDAVNKIFQDRQTLIDQAVREAKIDGYRKALSRVYLHKAALFGGPAVEDYEARYSELEDLITLMEADLKAQLHEQEKKV